MKCLILAAGRGVRMLPLTYETPKPMLPVLGKPILSYTLEFLPKIIDEVIFVIGYLGKQIKDFFGDNYGGRKISYITQEKFLGTGHALFLAKDFLINERFLVLYGDDFYGKRDLEKCVKHDLCLLTKYLADPGRFGFLKMDEKGNLTEIIELSLEPIDCHLKVYPIFTGASVLDSRIFCYDLVKLKNKEEYGLPQTVVKMALDVPIFLEKADFWLPVGNPEDLKIVEDYLKNKG